jgi:predicted ATP-dependent endonuclease of OLD family
MIEHIFIKNYKAFERENVPLDKHTLLIGTHYSGKTTVLEALDLFFNQRLRHDYIIDPTKDIVIEIHVQEERYRKVYSPPEYYINYHKCIGAMFDINHIKYLYVPKHIHNHKFLNDILSINLTKKLSAQERARIFTVNDYIDGVIGNSNYSLFQIHQNIQMDIKEEILFTKEQYTKILSNITYQYLVIGIDNVEANFDIDSLDQITKYSYQTIVTSNESDIMRNTKYYVSTLYKGNKNDDLDTIKKRLDTPKNKLYLLVEGKYDVNWFETALDLLGVSDRYTVIPCGGAGNITFVKEQLEKEGYKTIVITDGDTRYNGSLKRDVIELYADKNYINEKFHTNFKTLPKSKFTFFKAFSVKDDIVKNVLSRWAKKHLTKDNPFVREVGELLSL